MTEDRLVPPIVIVNDFGYVNGGTAQVAIDDAVALARRGFDVTFFCAVGLVSLELMAAGVRVICLDQQEIATDPDRLCAAGRGIWNIKAGREMRRLLSNYAVRPIVHVHGWSKALSGSVVAAAITCRAPIVVTLHDFFAACPNGGFYQYPQERICELKAMSLRCIACNCDSRSYPQKLYRVIRQTVQQKIGGLPGGVRDFIVHSALVKKILTPYLPCDARLYRIPMTTAAEAAIPAPVAENADFVMVSRLAPEKGPLLFAEAACQAGVTPVFVGEGRMRNLIMQRMPQAEITGWLSRDQVTARLRRARALVFPSLLYETFGLTVVEALAQGVPAIVADQSAAAELVEDGVTGLLFRTGDSLDLAHKLKTLKNSAAAAEMGRRASERYWKVPLTEEHHLEALTTVYRNVADESGR